MNDISELLQECKSYGRRTAEYVERMVHKIPDTPVIDRGRTILNRCKDQVVLDIGCASSHAGDLASAVKAVAKQWYGIDILPGPWWQMDLDILPPGTPCPTDPPVTIVVCGEILEHLSNPGFFLRNLKQLYSTQIKIFTVPNAFCEDGMGWVRQGLENVNKDHVAYYSYKTLMALFGRYEYEVIEWYWCKGKPRVSEGIVFIVR